MYWRHSYNDEAFYAKISVSDIKKSTVRHCTCTVCCSCYLGLALALQTNGAGDTAKEAIVYLLAGMESLLQHAVNAALEHGEPVYAYICYVTRTCLL